MAILKKVTEISVFLHPTLNKFFYEYNYCEFQFNKTKQFEIELFSISIEKEKAKEIIEKSSCTYKNERKYNRSVFVINHLKIHTHINKHL